MINRKILSFSRIITSSLILITLFSFSFGQQMRWYKHYYFGLQAMKSGNYQAAAKHFHACLRVKSSDKKKRALMAPYLLSIIRTVNWEFVCIIWANRS